MCSTVVLFLVTFLTFINGKQFHDYMTKKERESIFGVAHDNVHTLKYEVVPLITMHARSKRSDENEVVEKQSIYLKTFGENFNLYLEENKNTLFGDRTPIINPYVDFDGKIKYDKKNYDLIPQLKIRAYHDRSKRAAVTIDEDDNGRINVNGHINDQIIIRSIPKRLHEEILSNEYFNISTPSEVFNETGQIYNHIVIKRNIHNNTHNVKVISSRMNSESDAEAEETASVFSRINNWRHSLRSSKPPCSPSTISPANYKDFTVYPKVLVVLDYTTYLSHHENLIECVRYAIAYWNAVDLRFREIEKPYIRLNVAGIIIAMKPNVTPYLEKEKASATSIYDVQTINNLEAYFAKENVTHVNYDIVVAFSSLGMVNGDNKWWQTIKRWITNSELRESVAGLARASSVCQYPRRAMAIVKYGGNLFKTNIAVHELGHIFGAAHDLQNLHQDDPNYKSDYKHGFVMSYVRKNKNQMHWSDFSIRSIQKFLQTDENNHCLLEKPNVGTPYRKILPGKIMSRDDQCKVQFGNSSYSDTDSKVLRDCLNIYCYSTVDRRFYKTNIAVAEGSYCSRGRICIEGECVRDQTDPTVYQSL